MEIFCSNNRVLLIYVPSLASLQPIPPFYIIYNIFSNYKMLSSKDLESYMKIKQFMTMNNIKDIYVIAKMTGAKLALMIVIVYFF